MNTAIIVALISVPVSVLTAFLTSRREQRLARLTHDLERDAKHEDRHVDTVVRVAGHTERLLREGEDLRHRLKNIRAQGFLAYLHGPRHEAAINTTLYRLAKFFAAKEMFDAHVTPGELASAGQPTGIANLVADIGRAFTDDELDRTGVGPETSRFMIWREEQRAMADVATGQEGDGTASLVRYTTFVERLRGASSTWFDTFVDDIERGGMSTSERMMKIEQLLDKLVIQRTHQNVMTRPPLPRPTPD